MSPQSIVHSPQQELADKLAQVKAIVAGFRRVIVAFSGGVDSTLLAKVARDVLGKDNVLAVTSDSPSLAREDLHEAQRLAGQLDLVHRVIRTNEVERFSYRQNTKARCYFCKQELFQELEELAQRAHIPFVLYGAIGDDQFAERPGQRAAFERGVRAPLQEVGLAKWEVRELAKTLGLPNWNRPQNACLSSRIPHGQAVTQEKLGQIEQAESFLRSQGFTLVRVRHLGGRARIEVGQNEVARFQDPALYDEVAKRFETFGFETVAVDHAGYRSGGADAAIGKDELASNVKR